MVLTTDSRYVVDGINLGWAKKWKENGWMRTKKERAMNVDLWIRFLEQIDRHDVRIIWTRGHSGNIENERCDVLANTAAKETDLIEDIGYQCKSCVDCQASVSLLSRKIKNKKINQIKELVNSVEGFFSNTQIKINKEWEVFKKILNIKNNSRKQCLLLPFKTIAKALKFNS